ncbi:MAG: hypothetical protein ACHQ51_08180 [Elusimicrobiota bacterium]
MKALPLLACLLLAAPAMAQDRDAFQSEIAAWRTRLPHVDPPAPLTTEFEPRLDTIAAAVKTAKNAADQAKPRKDFEVWKHDITLKMYRQTRDQGVATGTLDQFSERQRTLLESYAQQRRQVIAPTIQKAALASGDGAKLFYDGDKSAGVPIMMPGSFGSPKPTAVNAQPQGVHLHTGDTPPPVTSAPLSFQSLLDYVDSTRGGRIAHAVASQAVGFTHWCFAYVKDAFITAKDKLWAKISDPTESGDIGIPPAIAADYARALNKSPELMAKLGYRRVDVSTLPGNDPSVVPEGTVFDFAPGCAGYSAGAGHIEIVAARGRLPEIKRSARPELDGEQVLACSDGCHGRTLNYFRTYGSPRRVGRAVRPACMNMYVPVSI